MDNKPFPEFKVDHLALRRIRRTDIGEIFAGLSHPRVILHYGVSYSSLEDTLEQMDWYDRIVSEGSGIWWGIANREDDKLLGACGFNDWNTEHRTIDLGYWLLPAYWRSGIMRRALPVVLRHAFCDMDVHRIHADVEPENLASFNLLKRIGFTHEGTLRDVEYKDGKYLSLCQMGLIKTDEAARVILGAGIAPE